MWKLINILICSCIKISFTYFEGFSYSTHSCKIPALTWSKGYLHIFHSRTTGNSTSTYLILRSLHTLYVQVYLLYCTVLYYCIVQYIDATLLLCSPYSSVISSYCLYIFIWKILRPELDPLMIIEFSSFFLLV